MEVTTTLKAPTRAEWRRWLEENGSREKEIWLLFDDRPEVPTVPYLDAVEEALCFGWIDGIQKRHTATERAQRFTPRKKKSHWTELNKARVRRLIRLGLMTEAGLAVAPDLEGPFVIPADIEAAMKASPPAWENFLSFPPLYQRVRVGYLVEARAKEEEFNRRLQNFLKKTQAVQMFGGWNDGGRLDED